MLHSVDVAGPLPPRLNRIAAIMTPRKVRLRITGTVPGPSDSSRRQLVQQRLGPIITAKPNLFASKRRMVLRAGVLNRRPVQSSGTELAFMSLISHLPLTLTRASSELVWAAMLFFALST